MVNNSSRIRPLQASILAAAALLYCTTAHASTAQISGVPLLDGVISTLLYGLIGIAMGSLSFRIIDGLTPGDLKQQLTVDKNIALGIVVGLQALGLAIIIAAAIAG